MPSARGKGHKRLWILWALASAGLCAWFGQVLIAQAEKQIFMPGPLSPGHHQLAERCDICHLERWGGAEVLQEACVECHGEDRKKPDDSHPRTKFTDPRNADRLENIDALQCVTCHLEHRPEITLKDGLTQPRDVCFHCHAKIADDRPSHAGMPFDTCKDSGCHNFHNNRALYTDFLLKHLDEPEILETAVLPEREFRELLDEVLDYPRDRYPVAALEVADLDAPAGASRPAIVTEWSATSHAGSGVNCSACHEIAPAEGEPAAWTDHPDHRGCESCHPHEVARFKRGKHGMRLAADLPPMRPADGLLPMKADAADKTLTCVTCHAAHRFDVATAAVDSCLGCHDDEHSRNYKSSPHYRLLLEEAAGKSPPGSGVSCAGCHMPRIDFDVSEWSSRILVDHNQSANLSPNSKMIRGSCLHCHGLGFTLNALADPALTKNNFSGRPTVQVDSLELAREDQERAEREREQARQEGDG